MPETPVAEDPSRGIVGSCFVGTCVASENAVLSQLKWKGLGRAGFTSWFCFLLALENHKIHLSRNFFNFKTEGHHLAYGAFVRVRDWVDGTLGQCPACKKDFPMQSGW